MERYRTFGSYILFKELANDPLGHLYRAAELGPARVGHPVLLRVLDGPTVPARTVLAGFATARRTARALAGANVARGAAFIDVGGVPALVVDYLAAQPLSVVMERARTEGFPIPVDNALLILEKLALGLSAGLAAEVDGVAQVHGLLHPALLLVTTDGEALITGFGIGERLLGMIEQPEGTTAVAPYLAPEVLATRAPNKRADVYSLGALLLQLLTGRSLPASPQERAGILDRAELSADERPLPADLAALLGRALAPRPEDRYSSVADFKKELDRLLYSGAYSPTTFNLALFMDRLFRSEIELEDGERAAEQAVDVAPYLVPESVPEPEPIAPPPVRSRRRRVLWLAPGVVAAALLIGGGWLLVRNRLGLAPTAPPTPTTEQLAAAQQEQEVRLQAMVEEMVQQKMAERESAIRQELLARQSRIEELQLRLRESERRAKQRELSLEEQRRKQELEQQIAAEQQAQREQQAELEAEQLRQPEASPLPAADPTEVAAVEPTVGLEPGASATAPPAAPPIAAVVENEFYDPSAVDTLPVVLKEEPVTWPRSALASRRQGIVIVQATVNAHGQAVEVRVLRADHEGFGIPQAVVEAVLRYRFKPATKAGVPVTSYATVTKRYQFRDR